MDDDDILQTTPNAYTHTRQILFRSEIEKLISQFPGNHCICHLLPPFTITTRLSGFFPHIHVSICPNFKNDDNVDDDGNEGSGPRVEAICKILILFRLPSFRRALEHSTQSFSIMMVMVAYIHEVTYTLSVKRLWRRHGFQQPDEFN